MKSHGGIGAALFLDRDGTIIHDSGYMSDPGEVKILPGAKKAIHDAAQFCNLYLLTNQSGIGRGLLTIDKVNAINSRMLDLLNLPSPGFHSICIAPETPDAPQLYRKPSPRFILERIEHDGLAPRLCWMLGDRLSDLQAGLNAGIRTALIRNPEYSSDETMAFCSRHSLPVYDSLALAIRDIIAELRGTTLHA